MTTAVHDGAKELLPPRALRTLKHMARTVDMMPFAGTFFRELEIKFGHHTMRYVNEGMDSRRHRSVPVLLPED